MCFTFGRTIQTEILKCSTTISLTIPQSKRTVKDTCLIVLCIGNLQRHPNQSYIPHSSRVIQPCSRLSYQFLIFYIFFTSSYVSYEKSNHRCGAQLVQLYGCGPAVWLRARATLYTHVTSECVTAIYM